MKMLKKMCVGAFQANCYIYAFQNQAIIIDPGDQGKKICRYLKENELEPVAVLLTHGHIDHIGAINHIKMHYPSLDIYIHHEDASFLKEPSLNLSQGFFGEPFTYLNEFKTLKDNDTLNFDEIKVTCLHLPGHTPGSCMFSFEPEHLIFSGDVLFEGSIGRFDLPLGSHSDTKQSIEKIKLLDADFVVYPGHGEKTTIFNELQSNPYFK